MMKKLKKMFSGFKSDYKWSYPSMKKRKMRCYRTVAWFTFMSFWNMITAPIFYPIWYIFRKQITKIGYGGYHSMM